MQSGGPPAGYVLSTTCFFRTESKTMERYELDRAWREDYNRVRISAEDRILVREIKQELRTELLPHLKRFFSDFEVHFIRCSASLETSADGSAEMVTYVGVYIHGSHEKPIILLDMDEIRSSCREYDSDFRSCVESTIVHELGHAIQEWYGVIHAEHEAEGFAEHWWKHREVDEFWDGFESPEFEDKKEEALA